MTIQRTYARSDGTDGDRLTFVASTPGVKRDGLDLRPEGWRTGHFEANPVILWAHDYRGLPIGRGTVDDADADRLRIGVEFDQADDFAREVERKYRDGYLNAVSVGWDWVREDGSPIDFETWLTNSDESLAREFFYDLLELSAVPVPADADALLERQRSGLVRLRDDLTSSLDDVDLRDVVSDPEPTSEVTALSIRRARLSLSARP